MKLHVFFPRNRIINILILFFLLGININYVHSQISKYGNFPYEESCLNGKPDDFTFPTPQGNKLNQAKFTNGVGLHLTPVSQSTFGAAFIRNRQFGSKNGITIEFEYTISGGDGGDGLCMFLFDASVKAPAIGAHGAGIGYTYNQTIHSHYLNQKFEGLRGAYMGVAFDVYGNYKTLRYLRNEMRGGIPYKKQDNSSIISESKEKKYDTGNQVTIRGARGSAINHVTNVHYQAIVGSSDPGMREYKKNGVTVGEDGLTGYPVLITRSTNATHGFVLDSDGKYIELSPYTGNLFSINGGYRKAIIEIFPVEDTTPGGGFYITVKIDHDGQIDTIINDYHYKESFLYQENGMIPFQYNSDTPKDPPPAPYTLNASVPDSLRIGFAAATGEKTNNHIIRNIKIALPRAAEAYDDDLEIFKGQTATFYPLVNDIAYNGTIRRNQTGSFDHIDPREFRFIDNNGNVKKLVSGQTVLICNMPEGRWTYDITGITNNSSAIATFTPNAGYEGVATIQYDIKGKDDTPNPYADEAYRSLHAKMSVSVITNPNPTKNTITNKMITVRFK